ncbi:MAG TPA: biotin/lipoyl-containing protein, partial [bacterium]|nr:biotin/lipoyl-containing protein [bacterium]
VGYPLLLKAVAGGGGRGIRLVEREADLQAALEAAQREAQGAFKDARVMLEKYLPQPHHVEFQVLGDTHGSMLHLYERECSVQRRHQKIIEETPSPTLNPPLRQAMAQAAVQAARAIGYVGAGTIEFLVDETGAFYFMEMNTRLQVEHPITEMTLGLDLVRLQIEVAEGRPLTLRQEELRPSGHAIECRLNAENPAKRFLPSVGWIRRLEFPHGAGLRVDTGFASGAEISPYYDSLLAKLIAWGAHREEALRRMQRMLEATQCTGIATNLPLLQAILAQEEFQAGRYTTRFIERHEATLLRTAPAPGLLREQLLAIAAVEALLRLREAPASGNGAGTLSSPWANGPALSTAPGTLPSLALRVELHGETHPLLLHVAPHPSSGAAVALDVTWQGVRHSLSVEPTAEGRALLELEGLRLPLLWDAQGSQRWITLRGVHALANAQQPAADASAGAAGGAERLQAPLPGKVLKVAVAAGQHVREGEVLLILEAMKVEHTITAPYAGRITGLPFKEGDLVQRNDALVQLEPEA